MLNEISQNPPLQKFYVKVLHKASKTFQNIERVGFHVNTTKYAILKADLQNTIAGAEKEALQLLPNRIRIKYADDLSITRPALLKDYFFGPMGLNLKPRLTTPKTGQPSTAKSHFEMFDDVPEAMAMCALLTTRNQAHKALSTYVDGFLKHLHPDSRFRPNYFLHNGDNEWEDHEGGTNTGRVSAIAPAIQTVPKRGMWGKRIRECLEALPGYELVEADYAQGELKLTACIAEEETMLRVYLEGLDLHTNTGAQSLGLTYDQALEMSKTDSEAYDALRYGAKAKNFGLIYGMGAFGFQIYAWNQYRLRISDEDAEKAVASFHNTYPGLRPWHKREKADARQLKYTPSLFGRIRHLPHIDSPLREVAAKAERQAVNSKIQSMLSDMMCMSMSEAEEQYPTILPAASIHDAGYWMAPEGQGAAAASRLTEVMSNLPLEDLFGWRPQLTFSADAKVGPNLAYLKAP